MTRVMCKPDLENGGIKSLFKKLTGLQREHYPDDSIVPLKQPVRNHSHFRIVRTVEKLDRGTDEVTLCLVSAG